MARRFSRSLFEVGDVVFHMDYRRLVRIISRFRSNRGLWCYRVVFLGESIERVMFEDELGVPVSDQLSRRHRRCRRTKINLASATGTQSGTP